MIVTQYTTFPYGGAGTAAVRQHLEMRRQGLDSRLFHQPGLDWQSPDSSVRPLTLESAPQPNGFIAKRREKGRRRKIIRHYERHLVGRPQQLELFSQSELVERTLVPANWQWGDVVHLHWLAFLIDLPSFLAAIPEPTPVVWTLHDMNPFTGGCHYSGGCSRFKSGCGDCPALNDPSARDLSFDAIRVKQRSLDGRPWQVVTPSRWLGRMAQQSPVWPEGTEFHVIAYGLDTNQFRPIDKSLARRKLGLPQNVPLIAFGAEDIENQRKGFHLLAHALRLVPSEKGIESVVFGRGRMSDARDGLPIIHEFGYVDSSERQSLIYSAADLLVLPSLEDNAPQTGLEAMACGTPVVAFEAGGISEFVRPGQTGLLAAVGNVAELARQIGDLVDHPRLRQRLAAGSRKLIEAEYDVRTQARKTIELYTSLLGTAKSGAKRRAA